MTQSLEYVFGEIAKLPPTEQDALASLLMEEMKSERKWADLLRQSDNLLEILAAEALGEYAAGKTVPLRDIL